MLPPQWIWVSYIWNTLIIWNKCGPINDSLNKTLRILLEGQVPTFLHVRMEHDGQFFCGYYYCTYGCHIGWVETVLMVLTKMHSLCRIFRGQIYIQWIGKAKGGILIAWKFMLFSISFLVNLSICLIVLPMNITELMVLQNQVTQL